MAKKQLKIKTLSELAIDKGLVGKILMSLPPEEGVDPSTFNFYDILSVNSSTKNLTVQSYEGGKTPHIKTLSPNDYLQLVIVRPDLPSREVLKGLLLHQKLDNSINEYLLIKD